MKIIQGKKIADKILTRIKKEIIESGLTPGLAVVLIGENKASKIYVNLKEKAAKKVGIRFLLFQFSRKTKEEEIIKKIKELNADKRINGIIVQLPLPKGLNTEKIIGAIDPAKDVDGFHPENLKKFFAGDGKIKPVFSLSILKIIKSVIKNLAGKKAVIIAKSENFGRTMLEILKREKVEGEIVFCREILENNKEKIIKIKQANIVISACGMPNLLKKEMFQTGAIIADGGIKKIGKKVYGDIDRKIYASSQKGFVSSVPGGVGPVTVACLLENIWLLSRKNS